MLELRAPVQTGKPVVLNLVRWRDPEIPDISRSTAVPKIKENSTLDIRLIELLAEAITATRWHRQSGGNYRTGIPIHPASQNTFEG